MNHPDREACEPASPLARGRPWHRSPRAWGFTIIELMVVIGIVAVMMAIAVPSFRSISQGNRITSEVNTFVGDLQFARSEAIRRGSTVSICPSSDGSTCLTANTWHSGWIVFYDVNGNGTVQSGDTVMRRQATWVGTDTMAASPSTLAVTFNRDGFANIATVTFVLHASPTDAQTTRCVELNTVGRQTVQKAGVGSCS